MMEAIREYIEWVSLAIELLAVVVIALSIVMALIPCGSTGVSGEPPRLGDFKAYKRRMGRGLLLALELLLAADIIETVTLAPTLEHLLSLGVLAVIRSFLSWSLEMEMSGHWPWRDSALERDRRGVGERGATPGTRAA